MTNVVDGLEKRYEQLPADVLDDAIKAFKLIAERNGGRIGKYQLTAKPSRRRVQDGAASVLMKGTPSGFWTWKETGTAAHVIKPRPKKRRRGGKARAGWKPGPLGGGLAHPVWGPVLHPGSTGARKWTKTVDQADNVIAELIERALEKGA